VAGRGGEEVAEKSQRTLQQPATMAPAACPSCGCIFNNDSAVLKHMNHRYTSCHLWFVNNSPPSPHSQHPPDIQSYHFPNAGHVYNLGPGFLGWFNNDEDAAARTANPYHPFLSKGEWEIVTISTPFSFFTTKSTFPHSLPHTPFPFQL